MTVINIISRTNQEIPLNLLLLADPSEKMIDQYLATSEVYLATTESKTLGVLVLKVKGNEAEIMNLAIDEAHQGKGIGSQLIHHAIQVSKVKNLKRLVIGTADTSEYQLQLYQHLGFVPFGRIQNFFIQNYETPIFENGKQAKDMIKLEMSLT